MQTWEEQPTSSFKTRSAPRLPFFTSKEFVPAGLQAQHRSDPLLVLLLLHQTQLASGSVPVGLRNAVHSLAASASSFISRPFLELGGPVNLCDVFLEKQLTMACRRRAATFAKTHRQKPDAL